MDTAITLSNPSLKVAYTLIDIDTDKMTKGHGVKISYAYSILTKYEGHYQLTHVYQQYVPQ